MDCTNTKFLYIFILPSACLNTGDRLTNYNGTALTYDNIGNPLSYYNGQSYTLTWKGRELTGATFQTLDLIQLFDKKEKGTVPLRIQKNQSKIWKP